MFEKLFPRKKKTESESDKSIEFLHHTEIFWLERELEFQHQNENLKFRTNENDSLKFGKLINSLFDIRNEEVTVLSINDGNLQTITDKDEIWNYEFLQNYKRNEKGECTYDREGCSKLRNQIVLTLAYRTYGSRKEDKDVSISKIDAMLIVHLQYPLGIKDEAVYIQATFCRPIIRFERSKHGINPQSDCLTLLIAFDYKKQTQTEDEFFNIFNSANNKVKNEKYDELNYVEKELLALAYHPNISKEFHFGKQVMSENRYWDAILYFENAFKALQNQWWNNKLDDNQYDILLECSFCIGYCYYAIGLFDKSFKYLEFSAQNGNEVQYQSEYINCLIALHDIRSLMVIDNHLKRFEAYAKEKDFVMENDFFYLFLIRRKAYCFVELKQYDQAKIYLNKVLEIDPNNQYAKNELTYIRQVEEAMNK